MRVKVTGKSVLIFIILSFSVFSAVHFVSAWANLGSDSTGSLDFNCGSSIDGSCQKNVSPADAGNYQVDSVNISGTATKIDAGQTESSIRVDICIEQLNTGLGGCSNVFNDSNVSSSGTSIDEIKYLANTDDTAWYNNGRVILTFHNVDFDGTLSVHGRRVYIDGTTVPSSVVVGDSFTVSCSAVNTVNSGCGVDSTSASISCSSSGSCTAQSVDDLAWVVFSAKGPVGADGYDTVEVLKNLQVNSASALPPGVNYTLTVSRGSDGSVSSSPAGISCGSDCTEVYPSGQKVALTASPNSGYHVVWTGCKSSSGNQCDFMMDKDRTIVADFVSDSAPPPPPGSVTCAPGSVNTTVNTSVSLVASDGDGTYSWSGGGSPATGSGSSFSTSYSTSGTKTVTVTSAGTSDSCTVNVSSTQPPPSPPGGFTLSASCSGGNSPQANLSWTLPSGVVDFYSLVRKRSGELLYSTIKTGITERSYSDTGLLSSTDYFYIAKAVNSAGTTDSNEVKVNTSLSNCGVPSNFKLTVGKAGTGSGTVTSSPVGINCGSDCTEDYASGTGVTLTPSSSAGSVFTGWGGACSGTGSCVLVMNDAKNVTATFNLSGEEGGGSTGDITVINREVTTNSPVYACWTLIRKSPNPAQWTGQCATSFTYSKFPIGEYTIQVNTNNSTHNFSSVQPASSQNLGSNQTISWTVYWSPKSQPPSLPPSNTKLLTVSVEGRGRVTSSPAGIDCGPYSTCSANFLENSTVTLNPNSEVGWGFDDWKGSCSGGGACSLVMSSNKNATANFSLRNVQPPPPACPDKSKLTFSGPDIPSTLSPGQTVNFKIKAYNPSGDNSLWFPNGYRMIQLSSLNISPTTGNIINGVNNFNATVNVRPSEAFYPEFTLTAPSNPGTYSVVLQMVHNSGWEYRDKNDNICAQSPASDREFGDILEDTFTIPQQTLTIDLKANPNSGNSPLPVTLTAEVTGGTATGTINYSFWWDCSSPTTSVATASSQCGNLASPPVGSCAGNGFGLKCNAINDTGYATFPTFSSSKISKVIIERGTAPPAQDMELITVTQPLPVVSNVTVSQPNYCVSGPAATINWDYSDQSGSPQSAYQVQIDDQGSFSSLEVDSGKVTCENCRSYFSGQGPLQFNKTYKARVKVWNSSDQPSNWTESGSFKTPDHAYPNASPPYQFTYSPTNPAVNDPIQFTDRAWFDPSSNNKQWSWTFVPAGGGSGSSTAQNPVYSFNQPNIYQVTENIRDNAMPPGQYCAGPSQAINIQKPIPIWKEVAPR